MARPIPPQWENPVTEHPRKSGRHLWVWFIVGALVLAVAGLVVSGQTGHTVWTWIFGVGLMAALPLSIVIVLLLAVVSIFRSKNGGS